MAPRIKVLCLQMKSYFLIDLLVYRIMRESSEGENRLSYKIIDSLHQIFTVFIYFVEKHSQKELILSMKIPSVQKHLVCDLSCRFVRRKGVDASFSIETGVLSSVWMVSERERDWTGLLLNHIAVKYWIA